MDRMSNAVEPIRDERSIRLFQRTLAQWAGDLLRHPQPIAWPTPQPANDYRDRNWKNLYAGSVLDD